MSQTTIIIFIIIAYLAILLLISRFTSKHADNSTFFIGGRKMPWLIVAVAMITAPISGVTFISVPGMVLTKEFSYLQMCFGFIVGYFLIAFILIPIYYKHNIFSIYSFLETRFGKDTYKVGAWFFLISKILGTAVKFLVVCTVLQLLIFDPLKIPFILNALITISVIGAYTLHGGVKTVVWADLFKSLCLISSVFLCVFFLCDNLGINLEDLFSHISSHHSSRIFFFDNPTESTYFWKQFIAGVFLVVAMTGMDQDMMQHTLSCRDTKSSRKNLILTSLLQFGVMILFLTLGALLAIYAERNSIDIPTKTDDLFAIVAFHEGLPLIVGILFILGVISASYSSVGSALTSLTTSFTVDIMEGRQKYNEDELSKKRKYIHLGMGAGLLVIIIAFFYFNNQDAITAVFTLASYTYGPILGLFIFGIFSRKKVNSTFAGIICILAPVLSWIIQWFGKYMLGYETGFELLLINALLILIGLSLLPSVEKQTLEKSGKVISPEI